MLSRYIVVLASLVLVVSISACGKLGGTSTDQPTAPQVSQQQQASPPSQQQVQQPADGSSTPPSNVPPTVQPAPTAPWERGPQADKAPELVRVFGESGIEPGQLSAPISMALDADGNFYVGDNKGLHKFDPEGKYLFSYGPDGYAGLTSAVAVGPDGTVYRSDPVANVVVKYTRDGEEIGKLGEPGAGKGQFDEPFGLTFDDPGDLYVVDRRNFRIQKFDPNGKFLMSFGARGDKNGEFINPRDVAVDRQGNIYVTDQASYLVQKFSPEGKFLARFGQAHGGESLWLVRGIALDDSGRIYISDGLHARVQVFDAEGNYLLEFGLPGVDPGRFNDPDDVVIRDGKLYVVDKGNDQIQEFALKW